MGLLSEVSAAGMNPDQAGRMLGWVNEMLSRNLRPEERERFFAARRELEDILKSQRRRKMQGLLSELVQRQNPNSFLGERLTGARRNIPGATGEVDILPEQVPGGHIRDFVPNRSYRDRIIRRYQPELLERWGWWDI